MAETTRKADERKAHFTFVWTIENASALLVSRDIESPSFVNQSIAKTKWKLKAYNSKFGKYLQIDICWEEDNEPASIEIEFELSILANDGTPLKMKTSKFQFKIKEPILFVLEGSEEIFFERKAEFLPNDALTVRCRMWRTETEISKADTCFARTRLHADKRFFVWAVREFSSLQMGQKRMHFVNPTSPGSPQLILSLYLSEMDGENYVNIQIDGNSATRNYWCFFKISLLDSGGKVVLSKKCLELLDQNRREIVTFYNFFEKDKIMNEEPSLLQNDVLILRCEFTIGAGPEWNRIENYCYLNAENLEAAESEMLDMHVDGQDACFVAACPFKKTLEDLYEDESLTDVSIRAGATLLHAHKSILSVRSPVFKAMFTQDMREKSCKVIDIPDFDADTLGRLLLYIYKDTVERLQWENAMDLFRAADKYQLLDLRKKCSFLLKYKLNVSNVCDILSLANVHEDDHLQKAAEDFISEHDNEVFASDAWKRFKMENFSLALEITERIILKRKD